MCGIGGVVISAGREGDAAGLRRMGSVMATRGPDDEGLFSGPGVGLIQRRLSILDLSALGNCPMPNEDGSIQVLLNGEIYIWRELRDTRIGKRDSHTRLWLILWLELWFRVVVTGEMDCDTDLSEVIDLCAS
jgi:asparagine synthase (glutamine-hydrolysing)